MEEILPGYTRVSEVLSIFQNYAAVDRAKLKKAQDVGTVVHHAIESYFKGEFVPLYGKLTPYFDSFLQWVGKQPVKPLICEQRIYDHDLMITGRVDLLCEMDGIVVLVDFKTGSWAHPEIWKLQATFYRELIRMKTLEYSPNHYLYIQLKSDGSEPTLFPMEYRHTDMLACHAALVAYRWFREQKTPPDERGN